MLYSIPRAFTLLTLALLVAVTSADARKFYRDDPLDREPKPKHVPQAASRKLSDYYDLFLHQFGHPGERPQPGSPPVRAKAVNTLGEPMQGAWWEKRHYYRRMTADELKGAGRDGEPPSSEGKWTVVGAKNEGITPGFVILDGKKRRYFIKFDPLTNPEMATAADAVTSRLFYALGYHTPQNFIVRFTPDQLELGEDVTITDKAGKPKKMTRRDLLEILLKVPRTADGAYRATASYALPGKTIGPPRWFGTRADDPNDIVPHEHRRDLRGLHVINAWVGHDDSRAINNIDVLVKDGDVQYIRHYQLDFGSTFGSATQKPNSARSGNYFFGWRESAKLLFSLGLYVPAWARADYPDYPSIGRFEWKTFDPERWVPEYPNPAFQHRLPDDEFWAAKQVMAMTDVDIRTIVSSGELSDRKAAEWLTECLIERRKKIGRAYFAKVLPFDRFEVRNNELVWEDLAATHRIAEPTPVNVQWFTFDNESEKRAPIDGAADAKLPSMTDGYIVAAISDRRQPSHSIDVYFRKSSEGIAIVGIERAW